MGYNSPHHKWFSALLVSVLLSALAEHGMYVGHLCIFYHFCDLFLPFNAQHVSQVEAIYVSFVPRIDGPGLATVCKGTC